MAMCTGTVVSRVDEEIYMVREHKQRARAEGKMVNRDTMTVWVEPGNAPGRRFKLEDLAPPAKKRVEQTAANAAGANIKALKKEIGSLKAAMKKQKTTHDKVLHAKVTSMVRRHEREKVSALETAVKDRDQLAKALQCAKVEIARLKTSVLLLENELGHLGEENEMAEGVLVDQEGLE